MTEIYLNIGSLSDIVINKDIYNSYYTILFRIFSNFDLKLE